MDRPHDPFGGAHADLPSCLRDVAAILENCFNEIIAGEVRSSRSVLIALLVCLIPTTIGALLSAVGIAGMSE